MRDRRALSLSGCFNISCSDQRFIKVLLMCKKRSDKERGRERTDLFVFILENDNPREIAPAMDAQKRNNNEIKA